MLTDGRTTRKHNASGTLTGQRHNKIVFKYAKPMPQGGKTILVPLDRYNSIVYENNNFDFHLLIVTMATHFYITCFLTHVNMNFRREYEFPNGNVLFLMDNDLPPFTFKLLCSSSLARKTRNITRESFYVPPCSSQIIITRVCVLDYAP